MEVEYSTPHFLCRSASSVESGSIFCCQKRIEGVAVLYSNPKRSIWPLVIHFGLLEWCGARQRIIVVNFCVVVTPFSTNCSMLSKTGLSTVLFLYMIMHSICRASSESIVRISMAMRSRSGSCCWTSFVATLSKSVADGSAGGPCAHLWTYGALCSLVCSAAWRSVLSVGWSTSVLLTAFASCNLDVAVSIVQAELSLGALWFASLRGLVAYIDWESGRAAQRCADLSRSAPLSRISDLMPCGDLSCLAKVCSTQVGASAWWVVALSQCGLLSLSRQSALQWLSMLCLWLQLRLYS
jgi:hypothetical protein